MPFISDGKKYDSMEEVMKAWEEESRNRPWYIKLFDWFIDRWDDITSIPYRLRFFSIKVLRVFWWIPKIWNTGEWDYCYIYDMLYYKLLRIKRYQTNVNYYEHNKREIIALDVCLELLNRLRKEEFSTNPGLFMEFKNLAWYANKRFDSIGYTRRMLFNYLDKYMHRWWI